MLITSAANLALNYSLAENVACLIEAMNEMENQSLHADKVTPDKQHAANIAAGARFLELRGNHGSFTLRAAVISLADECQRAFDAAQALTNDDPPCFDFEFCYTFLQGSLDSGLMALAIELQYTPDDECQAKIDAFFAHPADTALAA